MKGGPSDGQPLPPRADVVIVGGGILGAASAYQLARRGVNVVLLERGEVACAQSGHSLGFVRQQGRAPEELPLMVASNALWTKLEDELDADLEWTQGGNLRLTDDPASATRYEEWARIGADFGLSTRVLTKDQVGEILPGFSGQWLTAIFTASDGHADPLKTTRAFANAAANKGARLVEGCAVTSVLRAGGRVLGVETARGSIRASTVVLAAGAGSGRLAASAGLELPQRVVRSTVVLTEPLPRTTSCAAWTGSLAFRQTRRGGFAIGPGGAADVDLRLETFRHLGWFLPTYLKNRRLLRMRVRPRRFFASAEPDPEANQSDVQLCIALLSEYFPNLGAFGVARAWAGNIEGTPDALPVIDAPTDPQGLVVATGSSGHGFGMAPVVGVVVADLVTRGKSDFDLKPLRLSRFAEGAVGPPRHLL